jgi:hypothetical protein
MLDINHKCDAYTCSHKAEECYCEDHVEKIRKEAFDEGYEEGKQWVRE